MKKLVDDLAGREAGGMLPGDGPQRLKEAERHERGEDVRLDPVVQLVVDGPEAEVVLQLAERILDLALDHEFMENGINYDDLTPEEQDEFEDTFEDEDFIPKQIDSSALNQWLFNKDTIRKVLDILMTKGHRVHFGKDIGKTIIFAKNHRHAEEILKVFNEEYPKLTGYAEVIDNQIKNSQQAIDTDRKSVV